MNEDVGRVQQAEPGSRASTEPVCAVSALTGFDPSREWAGWLANAAKLANDAWTRDRDVRISCTPNGFWVEGRLLVRGQKTEVRAQQLRPFVMVAAGKVDTLTPAVERVLYMLERQAERVRDSDSDPQGKNGEAG